MSPTLSKDQIIAALSLLNDKLAERSVSGEVCIFGGAAMVLAFNARQNTRDVDAVYAPKSDVAKIIIDVAAELGLDEAWLNDGVKGFLSAKGEHTADDMPQFSNLRVTRPTAEYLLALKLMAARSGAFEMAKDREDSIVLCRSLGIRSADVAFATIERYFPASMVQPRTQYFVEEVVAQLNEPNS